MGVNRKSENRNFPKSQYPNKTTNEKCPKKKIYTKYNALGAGNDMLKVLTAAEISAAFYSESLSLRSTQLTASRLLKRNGFGPTMNAHLKMPHVNCVALADVDHLFGDMRNRKTSSNPRHSPEAI